MQPKQRNEVQIVARDPLRVPIGVMALRGIVPIAGQPNGGRWPTKCGHTQDGGTPWRLIWLGYTHSIDRQVSQTRGSGVIH